MRDGVLVPHITPLNTAVESAARWCLEAFVSHRMDVEGDCRAAKSSSHITTPRLRSDRSGVVLVSVLADGVQYATQLCEDRSRLVDESQCGAVVRRTCLPFERDGG